MGRNNHKRRATLVWLALGAVTVAVYWPVLQFGFINYDDSEYVTQNPYVRAGLCWPSVRWAFTTFHIWNWHPITWLSHMLDWQLFGPAAGAHHAVSLFFHIMNALLVYGLLWRLTGAFWRSALVAALFAVHPLHVESVAWISERKDLLCVFFGLLSLIAYVRYAALASDTPSSRGPGEAPRLKEVGSIVTRAGQHRWLWYALSLLLFAFGLMSKPMVVTFPFLMLLFDWWPLRRIPLFVSRDESKVKSADLKSRVCRVIVEKLPFFIMGGASCLVTFLAQSGGAVVALAALPLSGRLANAVVAYGLYALKLVWPSHLAAFYPHPGVWPAWEVTLAVTALLLISVALLTQARKHPAPVMGWLWFLGTLVPVIGIVQAGSQSMADRYTYFPAIGFFLMVVWGAADWKQASGSSSAIHRTPGSGGGLGAGVSIVASVAVLAVCAMLSRSQVHYWRDSEVLFSRALEVTAENPTAHFYLGNALVEKGNLVAGISHLQRAVELKPAWPEAHNSLAYALGLGRDWSAAAAHYREAIRLWPAFLPALNNLAWLLATGPEDRIRNGAEAVRLAEEACRITGFKNSLMVGTLAAAYAECGRFPEAVETAQKANAVALELGDQTLAKIHLELLEIYRSHRPYRQPAGQAP